MKQLVPYLVVLAVLLVFFVLCFLLFRQPASKSASKEAPQRKQENDKEGRLAVSTSSARGVEKAQVSAPQEDELDVTAPTRVLSAEELQSALGISAQNTKQEVARKPGLDDKTELIELVPEEDKSGEVDTSRPVHPLQEADLVAIAMQPILKSLGRLSNRDQVSIQTITKEALARLRIRDEKSLYDLLGHIAVQEALMHAQKAYAITPTPWMRSVVLDVFVDVAEQPKSSTRYMIAFDALRILPNLTLGHLQTLAISLLLQYSCNSNNYSLEYFRHYIDKYLVPFVSDISAQLSIFEQLKYAGCIQEGQNTISLCQILSNSYPYVFTYQGFTREELIEALGGEAIDSRFVVRALNSDLYKLAMTDVSVAPRFFKQAGIHNKDMQERLLNLMESKPISFAGRDARSLMKTISPVLYDLADLFDHSSLSRTTLTLLGLYLGRLHVKAVIGEDFDMSQWF